MFVVFHVGAGAGKWWYVEGVYVKGYGGRYVDIIAKELCLPYCIRE